MSLGGDIVEEGIDILVWEAEDGFTYSAEIDGIDVGELEGGPIGGFGTLFLSLGPGGPPVPPELSPVTGIDVIRILRDDGVVVMEGSFSDPCSDLGTGNGLFRLVFRGQAEQTRGLDQ
jgi:hypothetical protein